VLFLVRFHRKEQRSLFVDAFLTATPRPPPRALRFARGTPESTRRAFVDAPAPRRAPLARGTKRKERGDAPARVATNAAGAFVVYDLTRRVIRAAPDADASSPAPSRARDATPPDDGVDAASVTPRAS